MSVTKFGFTPGFDTQKRRKHDYDAVARLSDKGLSVRKIAKELGIPSGSVYYILKSCGKIELDNSRPGLKYITRSEARYLYDISDSSFDYYRGRYKDRFKKVGNVVYADRDVFEDHVIDKKGYKDRYKESNNG